MDFFFTVGNCGIKLLSFLSENNLFLMNSRKFLVLKRIILHFCREYQDGFLIFLKLFFRSNTCPEAKSSRIVDPEILKII